MKLRRIACGTGRKRYSTTTITEGDLALSGIGRHDVGRLLEIGVHSEEDADGKAYLYVLSVTKPEFDRIAQMAKHLGWIDDKEGTKP